MPNSNLSVVSKFDSLLKGNQIYTGLLSAFAFVYPANPWMGTWLLLLCLVIWFVRKCEWENKDNWNVLAWPLVIYFILHIIGLTYSDNIPLGLNDLQSKSALLLVPLIFCTIPFSKLDIRKILQWFVLGTVASNLLYLGWAAWKFLFLDAPSSVFFYSGLTTPFMNHPAYIASYSIFGVLFFFELIRKNENESKTKTRLYLIGAVFLFLMVILYSSRMQILTMCVVISIFFSWYLYKRKKWALIVGSILCIWGFTFLTINALPYAKVRLQNALSNADVKADKNIRFELWDTAWNAGWQSPIIGTGLGDEMPLIVADYKRKNLMLAAQKELNTHNQYLESFVVLGIFGLISYLLLLIIPSLRALRIGTILIISFYLIFALGTLTECMLESQRGSVWLAVFGSLFWGREDFLNE